MKPRRFKIISSSSGTLFECMDQPVTTMAEEVVDSGGRVPHVQSHACLRHEYARAFRARATHACGLAVFAQPCCIRIVVFLFLPNLGRDSNNTIFYQFFCQRFKLQTIPVLSVNGSRRHIRRIRYICILPVSHVQPSSAFLCSSA